MPILEFDKGKSIRTKEGEEFVALSQRIEELPLRFGCRRGNCGVCAIEVMDGQDNLTKKSISEMCTLKTKGLAKESHRLACQCAMNGDVKVRVCTSQLKKIEMCSKHSNS